MPTFTWCHTHQYDSAVRSLFINALTTDYISHSEIQYGRAVNANEWQSDLDTQFQSDIDLAIAEDEPEYAMAIVLENNILLGAAFVRYTQAAIHFATLDDLMMAPQARGSGLGGQFLSWIEKEIKQQGINHIFLESGIRNQGAHHFFEKHGFTPVSVTMLKTL